MTNLEYYKLNRWSYSSMKKILDHGIDYAVGAKNGDFEEKYGTAVNLGQLAHAFITGGEDNFAVSPFDDFRKKEAREWRDQMEESGKIVISKKQYEEIVPIIENIEKHPYFEKYLGKKLKHEVELTTAKISGVEVKGKTDVLDDTSTNEKNEVNFINVNDLKTTAQFDDFTRKAYWNHYDLQAALYLLMAVTANNYPLLNKQYAENPNEITKYANFNFVVAETVAPYRVKVYTCSQDFIDNGLKKLDKCLTEINNFDQRKNTTPNYLDEEIGVLGDFL